MPAVLIGLYLAMPLSQCHGINVQGKVVITRTLCWDAVLVA
jgi:hypothetical protein